MLNQKALVTVIVCTYNRVQTLGPALRSLFRQEVDPEFAFEILVVDDGSTDETGKAIKQIAAQAPIPLRYVREAGRGVPFARNRGILESQGGWLAFFDDDEIADCTWLRALMRAAHRTGAQIIGGPRRLRFQGDALPDLGRLTRKVLGEKDYGQRLCRTTRKTLACTGNMLAHRSLFERIGLFDTGMDQGMSDIGLSRRALDAGEDSWYTPDALVWHLIPPYRLQEDYLRWTCLRVGMNHARINHESGGALCMLYPCLLRAGHAVSLNALLAATAFTAGRREAILERKCYRWIAEGSARMALHLLLPQLFAQKRFLQRLAFRRERIAFRGKDDGPSIAPG